MNQKNKGKSINLFLITKLLNNILNASIISLDKFLNLIKSQKLRDYSRN